MKSTQSFWERRQLLYYNVPIAIAQALGYENTNESFSPVLLNENFEKLLGQNHLQGLSLPQCLRLCNSKELDLCGTANGMKIPDVKVARIFEDTKLLNEILEKPGLLIPLMTPRTAPTKFEMVQESLKSGAVILHTKFETFIITSCSDHELITALGSRISIEEVKKYAREAWFADDLRMIIFQDFSVHFSGQNHYNDKIRLIIEVLKKKRKRVLVGMRIDGFLYCVLIVKVDMKAFYVKEWRWKEEGDDPVPITFDYFYKNAIEAYFFDSKSPSSEIDDLVVGSEHLEFNHVYIQPVEPTKTTDSGEYETSFYIMKEPKSMYLMTETSTTQYYDSVIFKNSEGLEYSFSPATGLDYPALTLNSNFTINETGMTENSGKTAKGEAGAAYPTGLHLIGGLEFTSGKTGGITYKKNDDRRSIPVYSRHNANQTNPSTKRLWGLRVINQAQNTPINSKLTALSLHIIMADQIFEHKFSKRPFLFRFWKDSNPKIFHDSCQNKRLLKKVACQFGETKHVYEIKSSQLIVFEEWPGNYDYGGFLFCLEFRAAEGKRLFCGLVRANSQPAQEKLILEFKKHF